MGSVGIALLGLGAWGRNHFRVLREMGVLRAVFDPDAARLEGVPQDLCAQSVEALLANPQVSAVVIATPARSHAHLAQQAIEAGKDVLVEKPLTLDLASGEQLLDSARRAGRLIMVGHITLFHPAIEKLRSLLADGALGRPRYLYSNRLNRGTVREEEDILWSFAPHDLAIFLHLLEAWPTRVVAHGGSWLSPGRADLTITHLDFEANVKGHIFVSWLHPLKEHRLIVVGDQRMAVFVDGPGGGKLTLHDPADPPLVGQPAHPAEVSEVPFDSGEPLRRELEHFVQCVAERREPLSGGAHGLEVLGLLAAAQQSLGSGEPVHPPRPGRSS